MLIKGVIAENTKNLIPNPLHKNFTEGDVVIEEGTLVEGVYKDVEGLRRGEPFTYRLFFIKDGPIIYQNKIKNTMPVTEVMLGADQSQSSTLVNLKPAEIFTKMKLAGVVIGGISGFAYAKYKKHDMKKSAMYIGVGALVGFAAAYVLDTKKKATVTPSK
jgi:hypothetical protein